MSIQGKSLMLFVVSLLSGCIVTTSVVETYDEDCQIVTKRVVLNKGELAAVGNCPNKHDCVGALAGMGVMSAASVVISGSVVIVGSAVYWLEKQGRCQRKTA